MKPIRLALFALAAAVVLGGCAGRSVQQVSLLPDVQKIGNLEGSYSMKFTSDGETRYATASVKKIAERQYQIARVTVYGLRSHGVFLHDLGRRHRLLRRTGHRQHLLPFRPQTHDHPVRKDEFPMRALPIILVAAALATACEFQHGTTVPKEEYDAVVNAYNELKVSAEATRDSYIESATAVDNILQELSQISGSTAVLRTDVEQGTARLNQVEMIENSISDIKGKLSQLERLTQDNAQYKKLVSSLKTVIAEKEKEIEDLKAEIQDKDRTISEQSEEISAQRGTIVLQNETISAQQENLEKAVREQARLLYQAGVDFEELGDESPSVSRRKDKAKVKSLTLEMYEKAVLYYSKAQETGYPGAADRIAAVKEKMATLAQ